MVTLEIVKGYNFIMYAEHKTVIYSASYIAHS